MSRPEDIAGPIIVWTDYGCEGWSPASYPTVAEALLDGFGRGNILTQAIPIAMVVREPAPVAAVSIQEDKP